MFPYFGDKKILPGYVKRCMDSQSDVVSFCPKRDVPSEMKYKNLTLEQNKKFLPYLIKKPKKKKRKSKRKKKKNNRKKKRRKYKKKKGKKRRKNKKRRKRRKRKNNKKKSS